MYTYIYQTKLLQSYVATQNNYRDPYRDANSNNPFDEHADSGEHRDDGPPQAMLEAYGASSRGGSDPHSNVGYTYPKPSSSPLSSRRLKKYWLIAAVVLAVVAIAAVLGGVLGSRNSDDDKNNDDVNSSAAHDGIGSNGSNDNDKKPGSGSYAPPPPPVEGETLGRKGSTITQEDGKTFIYQNDHGGYWVSTPFDDSAKAQDYTPALNEPWDFTNMK